MWHLWMKPAALMADLVCSCLVFEILLEYQATKSWKDALMKVMPQRKLEDATILKEEEEEAPS